MMSTVNLGVPTVRHSRGDGADVASAATSDDGRPRGQGLLDRHGRVATDLRVSLTDRCNLRCTYCMPPEGLTWMQGASLLTDAELVRLIGVAVRDLGITEVRFTGGEPLLRRGLEGIIEQTSSMRTSDGQAVRTALTTNGIGLARRAGGLASAGLDRVNVSLDTLRADRFFQLTRRDRHADVLAGVEAAQASGLAPVKINSVLLRGLNDDEAADMLHWALAVGCELRFIEQMPLDPHGMWRRDDMVTAEEILASLRREFQLDELPSATRGAAPAEVWTVQDDGGRSGTVGIIASVTRPFCGACDRVRLTADGQVRTCLFSSTETDLRALLREGATDEKLAETWGHAVWNKLPGHGIDDPSFLQPTRPMSAIGG